MNNIDKYLSDKKKLIESKKVGCFYCCEEFKLTIKERLNGHCPKCNSDSIVGENQNPNNTSFECFLTDLYCLFL